MKRPLLRRLYACGLLASLLIVIGACSALTPDDPAATLRAEREGYVAEATNAANADLQRQTEVAVTSVSAQTAVAQINARNNILLATLAVVVPPTAQVIADSGVVTPGSVATPAPPGMAGETAAGGTTATGLGNTSFVDVATALSVRESDGCVDVAQTAFPADIGRIYVTARSLSITANTVMRVDWTYQNTPAFSESFTVTQNDDDFCLWFYIEPSNVILSPGAWSVQLFANDQPILPVVDFTVGA